MDQKNEQSRRKVHELTALYEVSQALSLTLDVESSMYSIMEILEKRLGMKRATMTLLHPITGELFIDIGHGLTDAEIKRGKYRIGEGITGKVVETGKPAVIPRIGKEPLFLDRTRSRKGIDKNNISFICVPVKLGDSVIGAFSVDKIFSPEVSLEEDVRVLSIIASMIGQAVKIRQLIQSEKDQLIEENLKLRENLKEKYSYKNIIGNSNRMREVYEMVAKVAKSDATVLIRGSPAQQGTGGQCHTLQQPAFKKTVYQGQHSGAARKSDRIRTFWLRARGLYGSPGKTGGKI